MWRRAQPLLVGVRGARRGAGQALGSSAHNGELAPRRAADSLTLSPRTLPRPTHSQVDFLSKQWTCPFCYTRNVFPQHYADNITESNLPAELIPQFTTLEYQLPGRFAGPPAFLFVVDTGLQDDDLDQLRDSITQALSLLPPTALVGLISYGTNVHVHELSSTECPRSFVFKGTKDYDPGVVQSLLGLTNGGGAAGGGYAGNQGGLRFLAPVSEVGFVMEHLLEDVGRDPWPRGQDQRPARAIGTALSVATSLLERTIGKSGARILLFLGGPATVGPGATVGRPLVETMRSHSDLQKVRALCGWQRRRMRGRGPGFRFGVPILSTPPSLPPHVPPHPSPHSHPHTTRMRRPSSSRHPPSTKVWQHARRRMGTALMCLPARLIRQGFLRCAAASLLQAVSSCWLTLSTKACSRRAFGVCFGGTTRAVTRLTQGICRWGLRQHSSASPAAITRSAARSAPAALSRKPPRVCQRRRYVGGTREG